MARIIKSTVEYQAICKSQCILYDKHQYYPLCNQDDVKIMYEPIKPIEPITQNIIPYTIFRYEICLYKPNI